MLQFALVRLVDKDAANIYHDSSIFLPKNALNVFGKGGSGSGRGGSGSSFGPKSKD